MKKYFLIGGAPLTGKTTIIKKLQGYTTISSDEIRSWLKNILKPEQYPDLFYDEDLNAIEFYEKYKTAEAVFKLEQKQALCTQLGVDALIKADFSWDKVAIEGHAITPQYVSKLKSSRSITYRSLFLFDTNIDRIRQRIWARGLYDYPDNYPDSIKEIEVEWVMMYNDYFKTEAEKYGFELLSVDDIDDYKL